MGAPAALREDQFRKRKQPALLQILGGRKLGQGCLRGLTIQS